MRVPSVIFVLAFGVSIEAGKNLTGDQVLTLFLETEGQAALVRSLENNYDKVDFWSPKYADGVLVNKAVDIHFSKDYIENVKELLKTHGIKYRVKISNLQVLADRQYKGREGKSRASLVHNYNVYHPLVEINEWIDDIADAYPSLVKVDVLGKSTEGRDVRIMTITTNPDNPAVFIDCAFHAREWITTAFCQCFVRNLLEGYETDPVFTKQLNELTFYIMPVVNVDGYEYSWTVGNRMWRKTRSNYGTTCYGVDPNRNCDANWGGQGASNNSCDQTYHGPYLESEPEVKAFSDFIRDHKESIMVYLSMHSYGQLYSLPYSRTYLPPPTLDMLMKYAEQSAMAIEGVFGTQYTWGPGSRNLYLVSGGSKDFAYDNGIPWSSTLELRDDGQYGFLLPPDQIEGTCIETTAGVKVLGDAAIELYRNKS